MKLTKAKIDAFRYEGDGTSRDVRWDAAVSGFGVRIYPSGRKTFVLSYRHHGRKRLFAIGGYGDLTLEEARRKAGIRRGEVLDGKDPVAEREAKREEGSKRLANSFEAVVDDFIEKYAQPRQRTWKETERTLKVNCAPWLKRPIASITKRDCYQLLDGFVAAGNGHKARVTLSWLKTFGRWCAKRDILEASPFEAVEIDFETKHRERFYSDDEVRAIWKAADQLPPRDGGFVKLLLLLAPRKGELAGMRRSELDDSEDPTLWTVPFERTKSKKTAKKKRVYLTPLPPLAQRIIKQLPKLDEDLVFPGRRKGEPMEPGKWLQADLVEKGAPEDFTYHACRHTLATWLEDQGHSEYERGLVLNHAGAGGVTAGYSHGYPLELKRALLEKWSDHVAELVAPAGVALLS